MSVRVSVQPAACAAGGWDSPHYTHVLLSTSHVLSLLLCSSSYLPPFLQKGWWVSGPTAAGKKSVVMEPGGDCTAWVVQPHTLQATNSSYKHLKPPKHLQEIEQRPYQDHRQGAKKYVAHLMEVDSGPSYLRVTPPPSPPHQTGSRPNTYFLHVPCAN